MGLILSCTTAQLAIEVEVEVDSKFDWTVNKLCVVLFVMCLCVVVVVVVSSFLPDLILQTPVCPLIVAMRRQSEHMRQRRQQHNVSQRQGMR